MGRVKEALERNEGNNGRPYQRGERRGAAVIAEYIYHDEKREPYLKVERTADKQFPQSHWVRNGLSGRWQFGKPKGPKIPYMLPSLLKAAPELPIYICEGEKDVDSVHDLGGLDATCASEGAGKWTSDLNRWFEGRRQVVILADHDDPGRKHALKVARNLHAIVEDVRIVHFDKLPNGDPMPEGGDVTDWIGAGGTKEELLALASAAPVFTGLWQIQVVVGQTARVQDETEAALIKAERPVLVRAGKLVEPIWTEYPTSKGGKTIITVLRPLTVSGLAYMVTKHAAIFAKFDGRKKALVPVDPPSTILQGLLERGHWGFPRVAGVINAPTLRPDGTIIDRRGYDAATQLWYEPDGNIKMPIIPVSPTRDEAQAALKLLEELLVEFPFVDPLDRSVAVAAMLTAILRGGFDLAPLFLFLAHAAGTGKSFLVNVLSTIVRGRPCPVITMGRNKEEMEKRLGALLLEGAPLISIDNLSDNLEGDLLCQMTEQPLVRTRILGKSETPECEWRGTMFATGNNVTLQGDMTRRGLICNLDADVEQPEARKFDFDPIGKVLADRGTYIAAALTIARAYLVASPDLRCSPLASYGGWSRFVREPLIWLEQPDPVRSMDQARANDPERSKALALFEQWATHLKVGEGYSGSDVITCAKETRPSVVMGVGIANYEDVRPEFSGLLMETCPGKGRIDATTFGKWLSRIKGQVHGGYKLEIVKQSRSHGNRWALVKASGGSGDTGG